MTQAKRLSLMTLKSIEKCQEALDWAEDDLVYAYYYLKYTEMAERRFEGSKISQSRKNNWISEQIQLAVLGNKREEYEKIH